MNNVFSGLDKLGFNDLNNVELYEKTNKKQDEVILAQTPQNDINNLYDRKIVCPICGNKFTVKAIKTSSYKMKDRDSDFFIRYDSPNPYFYDVWLCNNCGYAAMKSDFEKIRNFQKESITSKITSRWKGRIYTPPYDVNIAIERYKLSLLNYFYMDSKASKKAMNCLKLAWMYRIMEDIKNEEVYLKQALNGFDDAYFNEGFPIYGMNKYAVMYLIGELNRRINNTDAALKWFSNVITTPNVGRRLKEMARDQKDLIKEAKNSAIKKENLKSSSVSTKKSGFFSSLFNKR